MKSESHDPEDRPSPSYLPLCQPRSCWFDLESHFRFVNTHLAMDEHFGAFLLLTFTQACVIFKSAIEAILVLRNNHKN